MPTGRRITAPKLATKLVKLTTVCESLAISRPTFWRRWHATFTDPRPAGGSPGVERKVFEDELAVAVEKGATAVLNYRRLVGRA